MTAKSNNAAGGSNGTTVSVGNSGGASGTAWDLVTIGTGATVIFDNTHIWDSPLAYELATAATAASASLAWTTSFSDDEVWGTSYHYFTTYAAASTSTAAIRLRGGAGVQAARISWATTGQVKISDTTTANAVTMTTACPVNAWYRLDWHLKVTGGLSDIWLYKNNPDAPAGLSLWDDHISASGALYGANPINEFNFGTIANNSNVGPYWLANIGASNVGIPGPPQLWVPSSPIRRPRPPAMVRRRAPLPTLPQPVAPPPTRVRYRPAPARRRPAVPAPTATPPPAPARRPRVRPPVVGRDRPRQDVHPAPDVPVTPPPVGLPAHARRALDWFTRRPSPHVPLASVATCTVTRPATGVAGRPNTGIAARPNTGITVDPC